MPQFWNRKGHPMLPGEERLPSPEEQAALLGAGGQGAAPGEGGSRPIGKKEIARAAALLTKYKDGKAALENRVVEDELWWELRHWEVIRRKKRPELRGPEPTSAWLFNAIINKHADAMDNFPEPVVLPRERSDEESAKVLSSVLPVILEDNGYEDTYSNNWWEKLKHGTAVYGIFWDSQKENGLGDIAIRQIDLLNIFWEPGITDIQQSRNLFLVDLVDNDALNQEYPQYGGKLAGNTIDVKQYLYDETIDTSNKSVVVDWYYKVRGANGRTLLHYAKFVGDTLLFASENEEQYRQTGWYEHGQYPVVLDPLFPEKGTPVGFGYVSICKDPQLYIDKLSGNILETSMMGTKKRFFVSSSTAVNEQEFLDWNKPLVHVEGELDARRLQEISIDPVNGVYYNVLQMKIEEMKDTAANRDVNSGGVGSGVTAASAIAALQEAGNKVSRDMIAASYRAHVAVSSMVIELIRQFYDETRAFRVVGQGESYDFVDLNNSALKDQPMGVSADGTPMFRKPVFDLKIRAQKKNPFSRMEQNERAKELYGLGFFNPERAQESLGALEMMDFEGKDKVVEYAKQGQTLLNVCQQMSRQMEQMAALLQAYTGVGMAEGGQSPAPSGGTPFQKGAEGKGQSADSVTGAVMQAQTPMTGYGQRLAQRSTPKVEG